MVKIKAIFLFFTWFSFCPFQWLKCVYIILPSLRVLQCGTVQFYLWIPLCLNFNQYNGFAYTFYSHHLYDISFMATNASFIWWTSTQPRRKIIIVLMSLALLSSSLIFFLLLYFNVFIFESISCKKKKKRKCRD